MPLDDRQILDSSRSLGSYHIGNGSSLILSVNGVGPWAVERVILSEIPAFRQLPADREAFMICSSVRKTDAETSEVRRLTRGRRDS